MRCSLWLFLFLLAISPLPVPVQAEEGRLFTAELNNAIKTVPMPFLVHENRNYINLETLITELGGLVVNMTDQIEASLNGKTATLITNHREVALENQSFSLSVPCTLLNNALSIAVTDTELFFHNAFGIQIKAEEMKPGADTDLEVMDLDESLLLESVPDLPQPASVSTETASDEGSSEPEKNEQEEDSEESLPSDATAGDFSGMKNIKGCLVIDAAHGGQDAGIVIAEEFKEKEILLQLAGAIKAVLEEKTSLTVVLTREADVALSPGKRVSAAEKAGGAFFVSLESNYSPNIPVSSISIWTDQPPFSDVKKEDAKKEDTKKENKSELARQECAEKAAKFGIRLQNNLNKTNTWEKVFVHQAPLLLQRESKIPVILIGTGCLNDPEKLHLLKNPEEIARISSGIAWALAESLR